MILGVTDPDGNQVTITIDVINSDEMTAPAKRAGGATKVLDATVIGESIAILPAQYSGEGNGCF